MNRPGQEISAKQFIEYLYAPLIASGGDALKRYYIGTFGVKDRNILDGAILQTWKDMTYNGINDFCSSIDRFIETVPHTLNYTVTVRSAANSKKANVAGSCCLWTDIDGVSWSLWQDGPICQTLFSDYSKFAPNVVVNSGWGVHLYWFLDKFEPLQPFTQETAEFEKCNKILAWMTKGDVQSATAEHLMRMPGSVNCKATPYINTKAYLFSPKRYNYKELSTMLNSYILKSYDLVKNTIKDTENKGSYIADKETISNNEQMYMIRSELESIIYNRSSKTDRKSKYGDNNSDGDRELHIFTLNGQEQIDKVIDLLKKEKDTCPFLRCIFDTPRSLSYLAWYALGCALNVVFDIKSAEQMFYQLSLPGNMTSDPESDIRKHFDQIVQYGYISSNCEKLQEYAGCSGGEEGCRNIIRKFYEAAYQVIPVKQTGSKKG